MGQDSKHLLEVRFSELSIQLDIPFVAGEKYFFEIIVIQGSLIKIGVSRAISKLDQVGYNHYKAFCDTSEGWAIYNGET